MLTEKQKQEAERLLRERPAVVPGTRAIADRDECKRWYDEVFKAKETHAVAAADWWAFCDLAGVAD